MNRTNPRTGRRVSPNPGLLTIRPLTPTLSVRIGINLEPKPPQGLQLKTLAACRAARRSNRAPVNWLPTAQSSCSLGPTPAKPPPS